MVSFDTSSSFYATLSVPLAKRAANSARNSTRSYRRCGRPRSRPRRVRHERWRTSPDCTQRRNFFSAEIPRQRNISWVITTVLHLGNNWRPESGFPRGPGRSNDFRGGKLGAMCELLHTSLVVQKMHLDFEKLRPGLKRVLSQQSVVIEPGASPHSCQMRAALAEFDEGTFTEGLELDLKTVSRHCEQAAKVTI
jgi:hypothetical protein